MPTPTTMEYLHASEAIYHPDHPEMAAEAGLRPFTNSSGQPMVKSDNGMIAAAYLDKNNNVIIAYQGTNAGHLLSTSTRAQIQADGQILEGVQPSEFRNAQAFADRVINQARLQGIDKSHVFATGHSLGGGEAEYVAQQNGLGGESFGAPGLPNYGGSKGLGRPSFRNHVAYGDPVGNFASDTLEGPLTEGAAFHYGSVHMVGKTADQAVLVREAAQAGQYKNERDRPLPHTPNSLVGVAEREYAIAERKTAGALLLATEAGAAKDNVGHHSLNDSYAPALGVIPLPEPKASRPRVDLSPLYVPWSAQVAVGGVIAQAAETRLASTDPWARVRNAAPAAQPPAADPARDIWRAQAAAGAATRQSGKTRPGAETDLAAQPQSTGRRLG